MTTIGTEADPENTELQGLPAIPEVHDPDASPQQELPFAIVAGEAMMQVPKDLYIPPDALEIFLEAFEGPLDLLLYSSGDRTSIFSISMLPILLINT